MVFAFINWYIVDGKTAYVFFPPEIFNTRCLLTLHCVIRGVIVFLWFFVAIRKVLLNL